MGDFLMDGKLLRGRSKELADDWKDGEMVGRRRSANGKWKVGLVNGRTDGRPSSRLAEGREMACKCAGKWAKTERMGAFIGK
jgi:hypothetical protein